MTYCIETYDHTCTQRSQSSNVSAMLGRNVFCHEAFDRRWSVCAWPGQVNAWDDLAVSGQCLSTRRMRLKLLPEALVRDELLRREDLESLGTAKRSTAPSTRETESGARTASAPEDFVVRQMLKIQQMQSVMASVVFTSFLSLCNYQTSSPNQSI